MFKIYVELRNVVEGKWYKVHVKKDDNQYDKEESVSASNPLATFYDVPGGAYTASATDEEWAAHDATFQAFQDVATRDGTRARGHVPAAAAATHDGTRARGHVLVAAATARAVMRASDHAPVVCMVSGARRVRGRAAAIPGGTRARGRAAAVVIAGRAAMRADRFVKATARSVVIAGAATRVMPAVDATMIAILVRVAPIATAALRVL